MAESAKGMAAVTVPDKRQRRRRRAESTAVVKPAKGAARCSKCYIRRKVTLFLVPYLPLSHILAYLLTCSLTTSSLITIAHLFSTHTYSSATRRGHSPTSTSHGHRFESELNWLAVGMGSEGDEEGGNTPDFGATVQARACQQA